MNKTFRLLAIGFVLAGLYSISHYGAEARLTGTNPTGSSADAWCVGKTSSEACVDSSGNVIPTTNNSATLGTSALQWATVNADDIVSGNTTASRLHVPSAVAITTTALLSVVTNDGDVFFTYGSGLAANVHNYVCISTGGATAANVVFSSAPTVACRSSP